MTGKIGTSVTCLIATQAEVSAASEKKTVSVYLCIQVDKNGKKAQEAERFGVPIVHEAFLDECKAANKFG